MVSTLVLENIYIMSNIMALLCECATLDDLSFESLTSIIIV